MLAAEPVLELVADGEARRALLRAGNLDEVLNVPVEGNVAMCQSGVFVLCSFQELNTLTIVGTKHIEPKLIPGLGTAQYAYKIIRTTSVAMHVQ